MSKNSSLKFGVLAQQARWDLNSYTAFLKSIRLIIFYEICS